MSACSAYRIAWSCEPEGRRSVGRSAERDAGLAGERVALGAFGRVGHRGEVVAGQCPRQFVGSEPLEVAGRREVTGFPVRPGEHVVGDLADEGLDEDVLAVLG